ncbi:MAG: PepSY-like domain-containing protein, partial [Chitinophagaceae bacterium]|nr:PepSY-like domain-containing protein [Chitinophagaceae bacterium]
RKVNHSILMDAQGNIIETEIGIEATQLPKGVLEYVKKHYPNKKIKEVAKITDTKETITYEVEIKGMDLIFNTNGVFVKAIKG